MAVLVFLRDLQLQQEMQKMYCTSRTERRKLRNVFLHVCTSSCEVGVTFARLQLNLNFIDRF